MVCPIRLTRFFVRICSLSDLTRLGSAVFNVDFVTGQRMISENSESMFEDIGGSLSHPQGQGAFGIKVSRELEGAGLQWSGATLVTLSFCKYGRRFVFQNKLVVEINRMELSV